MNTEWFDAARNGNDERMADLLDEHPELIETSNVDEDGWTALHCAAEGGHEKVVARLLTLCPGLVHVRSKSDMTALDCAIDWDHEEVVAQLLAANSPLVSSSGNETALHRASSNIWCPDWRVGMTALLLDARPDLIHEVTSKGETALHCAAKQGNVDVFDQLLAACPSLIDAVTADGKTVLTYAIDSDNNKMVDRVLDLCPKLIAFESRDFNAVDTAVWNCCEYAAEAMLQLRPDLIYKTHHGISLLSVAIMDWKAENVVKLWQRNPRALHEIHFDKTPFQKAIDVGRNDLVELFQWSMCLDDIEWNFQRGGRHAGDYQGRYRPVMEKLLCTSLLCSDQDVMGTVLEYMGFNPVKRSSCKRAREEDTLAPDDDDATSL